MQLSFKQKPRRNKQVAHTLLGGEIKTSRSDITQDKSQFLDSTAIEIQPRPELVESQIKAPSILTKTIIVARIFVVQT